MSSASPSSSPRCTSSGGDRGDSQRAGNATLNTSRNSETAASQRSANPPPPPPTEPRSFQGRERRTARPRGLRSISTWALRPTAARVSAAGTRAPPTRDKAAHSSLAGLPRQASFPPPLNQPGTTPLTDSACDHNQDDDPFGDQDRSSIGTFNDASSIHESEFSFRSSRTNVIPIAYIPPHSSSVSIADAQRGAFGQSDTSNGGGGDGSVLPPPRSAAGLRTSVPASMASRDSLALAGAELIELNPLPPVLTPDTPAVPHGATANGAPIRPPRSPGLDLNLPKISSPLAAGSTSSYGGGAAGAQASGTSSPTFLSPAATGSRGMSVLMDQHAGGPRARSAQSHLSTFTTRSGNSTMSYILDPPQIITPASGQGVRRVELHQGHAGLVKIGQSGVPLAAGAAAAVPLPHSPTSPNEGASDPFDDANEEKRRLSGRPISSATDTSRWTSSSFASDALLEGGVQFLQGQTVTFTNPNSPMPPPPTTTTTRGVSGASFDVPSSARSSEAFETGAASRALTSQNSGWSLATIKGSPALPPQAPSMSPSQSRDSAASVSTNGTHMSALEGIPFLAPSDSKRVSSSSGGGGSGVGGVLLGEPMARQTSATSSVSFGLPVNVTAAPGDISVSSSTSISTSSSPPTGTPTLSPPSSRPATISSLNGKQDDNADDDGDDALPAPFLPFAGQRPTSTGTGETTAASTGGSGKEGRVQSTAISVRSGFGSGLSQIPFQLGFPGGFGEGEDEDEDGEQANDQDGSSRDDDGGGGRANRVSRDSRFPPSEAEEEQNDMLADSSLDASRECLRFLPEGWTKKLCRLSC